MNMNKYSGNYLKTSSENNQSKFYKNLIYKNIYILTALLLSLNLLTACIFNDDGGKDPYKSLTIYHINDIHSHLDQTKESASLIYGGASRLKTLLNAANSNESVFLMAGDLVQGTLYYNFFNGAAELDTFNYIKIDAMCLGNHEFDKGAAPLYEQFSAAGFPVLAANINFKTSAAGLSTLIKPYVIINKNGLKIAVIGADTIDLNSENPVLLKDLEFKDPAAAVKQYAVELRSKVDLIVALTHIGYDDDLKLAAEDDNIDIIIGGHSHTEVLNPVAVPRKSGRICYVAQTGAYLKYMGNLKIRVCPKEFINAGGPRFVYDGGGLTYIDSSIAEDAGAESIISKYRDQISGNIKKTIATTANVLNGDRVENRKSETNLGNLYADAVKEFAKADIAVINGGSFRESIAGPDISIEKVYTASPYDGFIAVIQISGADLLADLKMGASRLDGTWGGFLHFSKGMKVIYENNDLVSAALDGVQIDPERIYKLASSDYITSGGDGHSNFANKNPDLGSMMKINEVVIEYMKNLAQPINYNVEGRIVIK